MSVSITTGRAEGSSVRTLGTGLGCGVSADTLVSPAKSAREAHAIPPTATSPKSTIAGACRAQPAPSAFSEAGEGTFPITSATAYTIQPAQKTILVTALAIHAASTAVSCTASGATTMSSTIMAVPAPPNTSVSTDQGGASPAHTAPAAYKLMPSSMHTMPAKNRGHIPSKPRPP